MWRSLVFWMWFFKLTHFTYGGLLSVLGLLSGYLFCVLFKAYHRICGAWFLCPSIKCGLFGFFKGTFSPGDHTKPAWFCCFDCYSASLWADAMWFLVLKDVGQCGFVVWLA